MNQSLGGIEGISRASLRTYYAIYFKISFIIVWVLPSPEQVILNINEGVVVCDGVGARLDYNVVQKALDLCV